MTRHTLLALAILVPAIVLASGEPAAAVDIDFEIVPGVTALGDYVDGQLFVPTESRLTNQLQLSHGVTFSSTAGYVALIFLNAHGTDGHATSGVNGIGGVNAENILKYNSPIVITFTMPGDPTTPAVTNSVSIRGDNFPNPSGSAVMEAFDINGVLLTKTDPPVADTAGFTLTVSTPNRTIHSVRITQSLSDIAFDDLRFNPLTHGLNAAPIADAGPNQAVLVGVTVTLNGSASQDPDHDPLTFSWSLTTPAGSAAVLTGATTEFPTFIPDIPGDYTATLTLSDPFGAGATGFVLVSVDADDAFVQRQIRFALNLIGDLKSEQVTTRGNKNALQQFLGQALAALRVGDMERARDKLMKSIDRTDGCVLHGEPDHDGDDRRDWITDCAAQAGVYQLLTTALAALGP